MSVDDKTIVTELRKVLRDADINSVTPRQVRETLSANLGGVDLEDRRQFIKSKIAEILQEQDEGSEADEHEEAQSHKHKDGQPPAVQHQSADNQSKVEKRSADSDSDSEDALSEPGAKGTSKPQPQDGSDEDIDPAVAEQMKKDEELARLLAGAGRRSTARRPTKRKKPTTPSKSKYKSPAVIEDGEGRSAAKTSSPAKRAKVSAFQYQLALSPSLASFFGCTHMTRSEATKRIWDYCKSNDLPKSKGVYHLDERLAEALGRKTLTFTTLAKALSVHMKQYPKHEMEMMGTPQ